jgi:uncharacterized metal-binding protein YceD (DUF177 family)
MKRSLFQTRVEALSESPVVLEFQEPPEALDLVDLPGVEFQGLIAGRLAYHMEGRDIFVYGKMRATARCQCVRCLEFFTHDIDADVGLNFVPQRAEAELELDERAEGAVIDYYEEDLFDPAEQLRELVALELPELPLCKQDCNGLCPQCGANLNDEPAEGAPPGEHACAASAPRPDVSEGAEPSEDWKSQLRGLRIQDKPS